MNLKEFFVHEIEIPEKYWEENKSELQRISEDALNRYVRWAYGYKKYSERYFEVVGSVVEELERKDVILSFLSREILKSKLQDKPMILEKLSVLAFDSIGVRNYPILDVLDYMGQEGINVEEKHPEWFTWKDTASSRESFEKVFERVMEGDFDVSMKTAVYAAMAMGLKERKMTELSKNSTARFFNSSEIPDQIKGVVGELIVGEDFFGKLRIGANRDGILSALEGSPEKFSEGYVEEVRRQLNTSFTAIVGGHLRRTDFSGVTELTTERKIAIKWMLDSVKDEEAKAIVREWLKKEYNSYDFPVMEGIIDFLKEYGETNPEFVRESINELKNANRYQVRKLAFEAGYGLFNDEAYLEEAKKDPSEAVRKWVAGLR